MRNDRFDFMKCVLSVLLILFFSPPIFSQPHQALWSSFKTLTFQPDQKNLVGQVSFENGQTFTVKVADINGQNHLSWQLNNAQTNLKENHHAYPLSPFELLDIRENVRVKKDYYYHLFIETSHIQPNLNFYAGLEHFFNGYLYAQIKYHLDHVLPQTFPDHIHKTQLEVSYENRSIDAYMVSCPHPGNIDIAWVSLEHAREKTTVFANLYALQHFLRLQYEQPEKYCHINAWFVPILNPDGFIYANTKDEFWRKNRRPVKNCNARGELIKGIGVDISRNFYDEFCPEDFRYNGDQPFPDDDDCFHSGEQLTSIFSDDPRSIVYRGSDTQNEAETLALKKLITLAEPRSFYNIITLHSAIKNGGLFHLNDQNPRDLAQFISSKINIFGYPAAQTHSIYNHSIPGLPEYYMHNRGIPMLTLEFKLNSQAKNRFDPNLSQYKEDQTVAFQALLANIDYWEQK